MSTPDLNLLVTLDVLLAEGSVARAAQRLRLSSSAMSRALARLRETTGDPLLVRAGRGLVPTPRALELRELSLWRDLHFTEPADAAFAVRGGMTNEQAIRTITLDAARVLGAAVRRVYETDGPALNDELTQLQIRFSERLGEPGALRRKQRCPTGIVGDDGDFSLIHSQYVLS